MSAIAILLTWFLLAFGLTRVQVSAWTYEEHRSLADSAISCIAHECDTCASLLREIGPFARAVRIDNDKVISDSTFGKIVAGAAIDEFARGRFHVRGSTVFTELRFLPDGILRQVLNDAKGLAFNPQYSRHLLSKAAMQADNVATNYLVNHLVALVKARLAHNEPADFVEKFKQAMYWESAAQGYLADAFSSSHMVSSMHSPLSILTRRNNREASQAFAKRGWYLLNSRGDVWQGFGDGMLAWYLETYEPVLEACVMSLRELFVVCLRQNEDPLLAASVNWAWEFDAVHEKDRVINSGWDQMSRAVGYLDPQEGEFALPTLRLIPMPITATWSERRPASETQWRSGRQHFPQLAEEDLHDSSLCYLDKIALYSGKDVPAWMIPEPLRRSPPEPADSLVKSNPDWASVQYLQDFKTPIAPRGLQIQISEQSKLLHGSGTDIRLGIGYGLHTPRFALLDPLSVQAEIVPSFFDQERSLYSISAGLGVLDILKGHNELLPDFFRVDVGYSFGSNGNARVRGIMVGPAVDYSLASFSSFNVGVRLRFAYRWYLLKPTVGGIAVGVVVM